MSPRLPRTPQELGTDPNAVVFDAERVISRNIKPVGDTYRAIPEPTEDVAALLATVAALKEVVETLVGVRGASNDRALKVSDLPPIIEELRGFLE